MSGVRCSENFPQSFQRALDLLSKRWTGLILFVLSERPLRFHEVVDRIQVIGDRILSERLKELEAEGILERRIFAEVPVRVEYHLTDKGKELRPIYEAIGHWAQRWMDPGVSSSETIDDESNAVVETRKPAATPGR